MSSDKPAVDRLLDEFEARWKSGQRPSLADFLPAHHAPDSHEQVWELIKLDLYYRQHAGEPGQLAEKYYDLPGFPLSDEQKVELTGLADEWKSPDGGLMATVPPPGRVEETVASDGATKQPEASLTDFLAPPEAPDELGRLGPYRILQVIGHGGMGVVYRAEDLKLKRAVALKAMLPSLGKTPQAGDRFRREAEAMGKLEHDHIVRIYQVAEDRGIPYLAMELLKGESLMQRLQRERSLPLPEVLRIGREIAEALAAAHAHGLIHRDIKPENVWLESRVQGPEVEARETIPPQTAGAESATVAQVRPTPPARVKVLDFGLARPVADYQGLTGEGAVVGTPAYMAPEQAAGEPVDFRSDLFSLGCVLYRMATGAMPFSGPNVMAVLSALANHTPKSPRELSATIPLALSDLIMRLLAKKPSHRPASARAVADSLHALEASQSGSPRRPLRLIALAAASVLAIFLMVIIVIQVRGPEEGILTIETDDPEIEVVVQGDGGPIIIRDKKINEEIKLPLGKYQVQLKGGKPGLKLETDQFVLMRGKQAVVKVTWKAKEPNPPPAVRGPPVNVPEPPPLAEWLKGRKVLTVAQDGSGQFKSIQAALNALKPHQVVKVLDRGPYDEGLLLDIPPEDIGLISEHDTVVTYPKWTGGYGHILGPVRGFRLHGFRFQGRPMEGKQTYGGLILWKSSATGSTSGLVIEHCCFDADPKWKLTSINVSFGPFQTAGDPNFFRQCAVYAGGMTLGGNGAQTVVAEENYFHKSATFNSRVMSVDKLLIRRNVFDYLGPHFSNLKNPTLVDVCNNTIVRAGTQFQFVVPERGIAFRNNIIFLGVLFNEEEGLKDRSGEDAKNWIMEHNAYQPVLGFEHRARYFIPPGRRDIVGTVKFLSLDPAHRDYLRIAADSPQATGGIGGTWPNYIGALPPGPAPKEGDWFTKLRQRWGS